MPLTPAFRRQWQEEIGEFQASQGYRIRSCLKNKTKSKEQPPKFLKLNILVYTCM